MRFWGGAEERFVREERLGRLKGGVGERRKMMSLPGERLGSSREKQVAGCQERGRPRLGSESRDESGNPAWERHTEQKALASRV